MHQLAQHVGGCVRGIFTDTIIVENPERPPFLSLEIGGVRNSKISQSNIILEAVKRFEDHQKIFIYRNDVTLTVWDLGRILNETQIKQREAQVIHDYHIAHKRMPYGNVQDYRAPLNKRVPDPVVIDNLFQWL